jgi:hypothetical protein
VSSGTRGPRRTRAARGRRRRRSGSPRLRRAGSRPGSGRWGDAAPTGACRRSPAHRPAAQHGVAAVCLIAGHPSKRHPRLDRAGQHGAGQRLLGGEADLVTDLRIRPPGLILDPAGRQVQLPVDQRLPMLGGIGEEHARLTVVDLAGRAGPGPAGGSSTEPSQGWPTPPPPRKRFLPRRRCGGARIHNPHESSSRATPGTIHGTRNQGEETVLDRIRRTAPSTFGVFPRAVT